MTKELNEWNVAAINNGFTPPDGPPENMNYSQVNNTMREIMAVMRRYQSDINGSLTAGGTPDALTITPIGTYAALFQGMRFAFKAAVNNTGAATLKVGSLAAVAIIQADGDPLDAASIRGGLIYDVVYTGASFQIVGSSALGPGFGLTNRPIESKTLVYMTAEKPLNSEAVLSWEAESYDEANVWTSSAPTIFTIPAALNGRRVRLKAQVTTTLYPDTAALSISILKNGSTDYIGASIQRNLTDTGNPSAHAETAWLSVVTGDIFRVEVPNTIGPITVDGLNTWFQLEVEPVSGLPSNLNFPIAITAGGIIANNEVILGPLAPIAFTIPKDLASTQARLETAPSGSSVVFSLQRNGTQIATISFASGSQTATFSLQAAVSISIGDRIDLVAPADVASALGLRVMLLATYAF